MKKGLMSEIFKNDKMVKGIFLLGVGLILIISMSSFIDPKPKKDEFDAVSYTSALEKRLGDIISEIGGVGKIKVMITLENLDEDIYSKKETAVITTRTPVVRGVAIVCEGGDGIVVKQKIVETVSKVLGISTARVCVTY